MTSSLDLIVETIRALKELDRTSSRLVHRRIVEPFLERLTAAVDRLKPGMPWDPGVAITPLPEPGKTDYLRGLVDDAVAKGARVVNLTRRESDFLTTDFLF
jgi:acyl-CoA reductase-like NAD-dependent aldehyde dehydrogenase